MPYWYYVTIEVLSSTKQTRSSILVKYQEEGWIIHKKNPNATTRNKLNVYKNLNKAGYKISVDETYNKSENWFIYVQHTKIDHNN